MIRQILYLGSQDIINKYIPPQNDQIAAIADLVGSQDITNKYIPPQDDQIAVLAELVG